MLIWSVEDEPAKETVSDAAGEAADEPANDSLSDAADEAEVPEAVANEEPDDE